MRRAAALLAAAALLSGCAAGRRPAPPTGPAAEPPGPVGGLAAEDRVRVAEAFRLAAAVGDRVWPGWSGAPFAVLLVTPEREYLLRHPRPSADFTRVGYDSMLGTSVFARARVFPPTLLATFPAVAGVPTVVIGPPALTGKSSTAWVLTLLHEHFHQLQTARPDYYAGVAALGLARGDETGMWMLNYAFPYDSAAVQARYADFARALDAALAARRPEERAARARAVATARARLRAALPPDDDRYLAFQMWQEGVARYTELRVARLAAARHTPGAAFRALPDYTGYAAAAAALERGIRAGLRDARLGSARRVAFYAAGAGAALLLDGARPGWRRRYFDGTFTLDDARP